MGNSATKEQRPSSAVGYHNRHQDVSSSREAGSESSSTNIYTTRTVRSSRHDLSFLGLGSASHTIDPAEVRKETKQEREARKLEKERVAREKERVRSMKEEHVDGGYLVTQGVYTGTEDFSKPGVRQFMIERRIAPFWYGLNDFKSEWTEHQLVAAAKGLPIPAADDIPSELEKSPIVELRRGSNPNINNLTVPIAGRSESYASDNSSNLSPSHATVQTSASSPLSTQSLHMHHSSPFRPRSKTLASLTSKNPPQSDIVPREIQLTADPYVNGQRMEAFLYKDATECPICFIYYPPYLNKTRCCDQPICSECFVQIKRPDPHAPEHEHNDPSSPSPPPAAQENPETLVSEPANCPYCQQAEFGVTYEPPPFRRGLAYANLASNNYGSAMSSSSSINSAVSPTLKPIAGRRRTTSVSASDVTVITTDKVRPDWVTKLANARNHAARRSAAATALHTAAYMMGNGVGSESRTFGFSSRFRHRENPVDSTSGTPTGQPDSAARLAAFSTLAEHHAQRQRDAQTEAGSRRRRSRVEDLEEMMMMEAIRLSLVAEEERKRKEEKDTAKEAKKETKKKEKAEKKAEKAAKRGVYGSGATSVSGSALSLVIPGVGRRRGNSGSSAIAREAAANRTDKGKDVDRGTISSTPSSDGHTQTEGSSDTMPTFRHHVDEPTPQLPSQEFPPHSPTITAPERPSHLRQMSNASSPASSIVESVHGSVKNDFPESSSSVAYVL